MDKLGEIDIIDNISKLVVRLCLCVCSGGIQEIKTDKSSVILQGRNLKFVYILLKNKEFIICQYIIGATGVVVLQTVTWRCLT